MNDENFYFGRLNEVSVDELASAMAATSPSDKYHTRAQKMFAHITALRKRREGKYETFARLYGKPTALKRNDRVIDGQQTIKHTELVDALIHLGWSTEPARVVAHNITCRVLDEREPKWDNGDVVKAADGIVWKRQFGSWVKFGCISVFRDDVPKRPLAKIGVAT